MANKYKYANACHPLTIINATATITITLLINNLNICGICGIAAVASNYEVCIVHGLAVVPMRSICISTNINAST